jgi:hypothetical protein
LNRKAGIKKAAFEVLSRLVLIFLKIEIADIFKKRWGKGEKGKIYF